MNYCPDCQTIEGKTRELEIEPGEFIEACAECDSEEEIQRIREHDDFNSER